MSLLSYGVVGAAAAALAYVTRLLGPKVRAGDTVLAGVDAAGFGLQLSPILGQAPFMLVQVSHVAPEGVYGSIVGAGVPMASGAVQVTRLTPFPAPPQQMGPVAFTSLSDRSWKAA